MTGWPKTWSMELMSGAERPWLKTWYMGSSSSSWRSAGRQPDAGL